MDVNAKSSLNMRRFMSEPRAAVGVAGQAPEWAHTCTRDARLEQQGRQTASQSRIIIDKPILSPV